jgi:hypothetical protein
LKKITEAMKSETAKFRQKYDGVNCKARNNRTSSEENISVNEITDKMFRELDNILELLR